VADRKGRLRGRLVALGIALVVLVPLAYLWATSLVPDDYSATEMGYADFGGGPTSAEHAGHHGSGKSVADLTGPGSGTPDVAATLVARKQKFTLASGESVDGYTLNGTSPGPALRASVGDLVQVTLVNESVPDGATLHWHRMLKMGSPGSRKTQYGLVRSMFIGSGRTRWGRTGITRIRCRARKYVAVSSERS